MKEDIYILPELSFVGGATQEYKFNLKNSLGQSFDIEGMSVNFAICNYSTKTGTALLSYSPEIITDAQNIKSIIKVVIPKDDTVNLFGKFIYQITIIDANGESEIPNQGIMHIYKNINQIYITQQVL